MPSEALNAWRTLLSAWDAWLLTFVLVAVVPALGHFRFRRFLARGEQSVTTRVKLTLYARNICTQWLLVAAMLLVLRRHGLSASDAGQRLADLPQTLSATMAVLAALAVVFAIVLTRLRRAQPETLLRVLGRLRNFVPACGPEMAGFAALCLTAGICEELLYRGWLLNILRAATGSVWIAVLAGAIVFGIGHAYQGAKGMLRTAFVGLQLGALYVLVGSLIPGQALHAGFDLLFGVAGALAVSRLRAAGAGNNPPSTGV
jgi:membrane protease YdiL (CAAX protease family)